VREVRPVFGMPGEPHALLGARVLVLEDASKGSGDYVLKIAPVNASGVPTAEVLAQATILDSSVPSSR